MKFTAYIWDHNLDHLRRDNLTIEALAPHVQLELAIDEPLYRSKIKVGEVDLDIELLPPDEIIAGAAIALRQRAKDIRAQAAKEASVYESKAEQLLAIENKPTVNLNKEKA